MDVKTSVWQRKSKSIWKTNNEWFLILINQMSNNTCIWRHFIFTMIVETLRLPYTDIELMAFRGPWSAGSADTRQAAAAVRAGAGGRRSWAQLVRAAAAWQSVSRPRQRCSHQPALHSTAPPWPQWGGRMWYLESAVSKCDIAWSRWTVRHEVMVREGLCEAGWGGRLGGSEGAQTGIRKLYLATFLTFHPLLLYTTLIFSIRACLIFAEQFHNNFACHNI